MTETSSFTSNQQSSFPTVEDVDGNKVEQLYLSGSTCDTFVVRIMGKLHFKKKLKVEYCGISKYEEAFRKEFETGFRLEHQSLPKYVAYNEEDGCPCILEEYIDGGTLNQFLDKHSDYFHNRRNADALIDELLSVVAYLHSHQILYLDLKPGNVMITSFGHHLRLVDLGGCRTDAFVNTESHTEGFAAPEQLSGNGNLDQRTDIFLIGRLLQYANVSPIYNKVVKKCLENEPFDRYQSVGELQSAIMKARRTPRLLAVAAFALAIIIPCLIAIVTFKHGEQSNASKVVLTARSSADTFHVKSNNTVTPAVVPTENRDTMKPNTKKLGETTKDQFKASWLQQVKLDLHSEMDKAFERHLSAIASDSTLNVVTFSNHFNLYSKELMEIEERIDKKYPNVPPATIRFEIEKYIRQTVTPLMQRLKL